MTKQIRRNVFASVPPAQRQDEKETTNATPFPKDRTSSQDRQARALSEKGIPQIYKTAGRRASAHGFVCPFITQMQRTEPDKALLQIPCKNSLLRSGTARALQGSLHLQAPVKLSALTQMNQLLWANMSNGKVHLVGLIAATAVPSTSLRGLLLFLAGRWFLPNFRNALLCDLRSHHGLKLRRFALRRLWGLNLLDLRCTGCFLSLAWLGPANNL